MHGEIGENAIFTMEKREFPRGFSLLGVQLLRILTEYPYNLQKASRH